MKCKIIEASSTEELEKKTNKWLETMEDRLLDIHSCFEIRYTELFIVHTMYSEMTAEQAADLK